MSEEKQPHPAEEGPASGDLSAENRVTREEPPRFSRRQKIVALAATAAFAVAVVITVGATRGLFSLSDAREVFRTLADAFTFPGVFLLGASGLVFAKRQGVFDGVSYSVRYFWNAVVPQFWLKGEERGGKFPKFYDYKQRKREKERRHFNMALCFLLVGGACCVFAVAFTLAYNAIPAPVAAS